MRAAIGDGAIAVQVIPRRSLPGMNAADEPSKRLVQQRMRNRAIEALDTLAEGDDGVRAVGVVEYVEEFFDVIDDRAPWHWKEWSTFIPAEVTVIDRVQQLLLEACAATRGALEAEEFISTGWPTRIQAPATEAAALMRGRGRFREDVEEDQPSLLGFT